MAQIKLTLSLRFFLYLFIIIAIPIAVLLNKDAIYLYYKSFTNNPYNLRVTNLTDNSATVTWYTKTQDLGFVLLNGEKYFDDRDVFKAESNEGIDGDEKEIKPSKYYTHHVTIEGLKPEKTYSFSISNQVKEWKDRDIRKTGYWYDLPVQANQNFTTLKEIDVSISEPIPAFGTVTTKLKSGDVLPSNDSVVFGQAYDNEDLKSPMSLVKSSVTNDNGGWVINKSSMRDLSGNSLSSVKFGEDKLLVYAQFANLNSAPGRYLTWGTQDSPDEEFQFEEWSIEDAKLSQSNNGIVGSAYAQASTPAATTPDTNPNLCCALKISGRSDYIGDFENDVPGKGCEIFDAAFAGKQVYGGTYESSKEVLGMDSYDVCEKVWTEDEITANNEKYTPAPTPAPTPTTPGTPSQPSTPAPTPSTPSITRDSADVAQSGNICCLIKTSGSSKLYRDFENGVQNKSCYDLFKNIKYAGSTITSISQDVGGRANENACVNSNYTPSNYTPSPGGAVGISCDTSVPEQKVEGVDKARFAELCYRGIYNRGKTYANECFNDVVYRSRLAGMNPKLALITWMHESACSNYEAAGKVEDFGIHWGNNINVSTKNQSYFNEQLNDFVCRDHTFKKCDNIADPMVEWAAVYRSGKCDEAAGKQWLNELKVQWNWFAKAEDFPNWVRDLNKDNYCDNQVRYVQTSNSNNSSIFKKFVNNIFAQENTGLEFIKYDANDDPYTLYFTQEGLYDIDVDGVVAYSIVVTKDNKYQFYREINGTPGYQEGFDERIQISLDKIRLSKVAQTYSYDLQKGFNVVSFPFLPTKDKFSPLTASEFINYANSSSPGTVKGIIEFKNGTWGQAYLVDSINNNDMGNDFNITYGQGYAILTTRNGEILVPGTELIDPVPVSLNSGLNLVAVHGYQEMYTAGSLMSSMNKLENITVESITSWDPQKAKYETYQVKDNEVFGFDFRIDKSQGYFIKLRTTSDTDTLIWQGN